VSGSSLQLQLRISADAKQAQAEIAGVRQGLDGLAQAGQGAATGLGATTSATGRAAEGLQRTAAAGRDAAHATRLTGEQMRQLAPQINDVATMLLSGSSPFQILATQGGQVVQIFGGVRQTLSAFVGLVGGPVGVAALAAAGGIAAIAVSAERSERALLNTTQRLRATRDDWTALGRTVEDVAKRVSVSSSLSEADARAAGLSIASQGRFRGDGNQLETLVRLSADVARIMGTEVPEAAQRFVARALQDPARAAREAQEGGLRGFNDELRRTVELLVASGRDGDAGRLVLERIGRAAGGAAEEVTRFQREWTNLRNLLGRGWNAITDGAEELAGRVMEGARQGVEALTGRSGEAPGLRPDARPSDVRDFVRRTALELGVNPALAEAVAGRESGFRQLGADGRVLTSSAGALGVMQLMPRTAQGLGVDPNDPAQNIRGGVLYLRQMLEQFGGDIGQAAGAYNAGPGRMREFLAGGTLPAETVRYVEAVLRQTGATSRIGDRIGALAGGLTGPAVRDTRVDRASVLDAQIERIERSLEDGGLSPDDRRRAELNLQQLRAQRVRENNPNWRITEAARDRLAVLERPEGAARTLMQAEVSARRQAVEEGLDGAGQDSRATDARARAQRELNAELDETIRRLEEERQTTLRSVEVQGQGAEAVREATIARQAEIDALRFAQAGTDEYAAAVARLTEQYRRNAQARERAALAPFSRQLDQEGDALELRSSLIGASAQDRAGATAELRMRQRLGLRAGERASEEQSGLISRARSQAVRGLEVDRQEQAFNELGRIGEQMFDRIGEAATRMALDGKNAFDSLKNLGNAVASELYQAFFRLALLNPLKNWLTGSNSPTLGDMGGVLGRIFGGGGVGAAPASWGDAASGYALVNNVFHEGGVAGTGDGRMRPVPLGIFADAPRFHTGGFIGPDEVPAILQRGEGVFTAEQMRALGPAGGASVGDMHFHFQGGDMGRPEDRQAMAEAVRAVVREEIGAAAPGIVRAATANTVTEANRGGSVARSLGRR
jgi:hypothetical protein